MKGLSRLNRIRELLGANSSETVAYHGTSAEMIRHLIADDGIRPPVIRNGTNLYEPMVVFPKRDFLRRILKTHDISENDLTGVDGYDEHQLVCYEAKYHAFCHRLNSIFGEALGTFVDVGDLCAIFESSEEFEGDLQTLFSDREASTLYGWLNSVLSTDQIANFIEQAQYSRFGVVMGLRERILSKIKPPSLSECRFLTDEGVHLKEGGVLELEDISSIFPLGKSDVEQARALLNLSVSKG